MKRNILFICILILSSCSTFETAESTSLQGNISLSCPVYLRKIELKPPYILEGIADELPGIIKSCLYNCGYKTTDIPLENSLDLDVFIHKKELNNSLKPCESVTIQFRLTGGMGNSAYRLYSVESEKSIESFPWTLNLIKSNLLKLKTSIADEN